MDEQALIDQMNASNMVAQALIDKEKEHQATLDLLQERDQRIEELERAL